MRAAAHLVDAGVAGEAAPDRLAAAKLFDPLRISDETTAECDEISLTPRDRLGRDCRIAQPSHRNDANAHRLLHLRSEVEKRRLRHVHCRDHQFRRGARAIMPGADVERVRARLRGPDRNLLAFGKVQPAGEVILDR